MAVPGRRLRWLVITVTVVVGVAVWLIASCCTCSSACLCGVFIGWRPGLGKMDW